MKIEPAVALKDLRYLLIFESDCKCLPSNGIIKLDMQRSLYATFVMKMILKYEPEVLTFVIFMIYV